MKQTSKEKFFWESINQLGKHHPFREMIIQQLNLFKPYKKQFVSLNYQLDYICGEWKNNKFIHGIIVTIMDSKMICRLVNQNSKLYPEITYTYMKDEYNPILKTNYIQLDDQNMIYETEEMCLYDSKQNEWNRITKTKANGLKQVEIINVSHVEIIHITRNVVTRVKKINKENKEYFIYELSEQEMKEREKGYQLLPYPTEPIDEQTYISIQNGTYFKQKSL